MKFIINIMILDLENGLEVKLAQGVTKFSPHVRVIQRKEYFLQ